MAGPNVRITGNILVREVRRKLISSQWAKGTEGGRGHQEGAGGGGGADWGLMSPFRWLILHMSISSASNGQMSSWAPGWLGGIGTRGRRLRRRDLGQGDLPFVVVHFVVGRDSVVTGRKTTTGCLA